MKVEVTATNEEFIAWTEWIRENPPNDQFLDSDLSDAAIIWAYARLLYNERPDLRERLREVTPEAVDRAVDDLGIFMGAQHLANMLGIEFDDDKIFGLMGKPVPAIEEQAA